MQKVVVDNKKFDGKHLSDFLFFSFNGLSRNTFFKALRKKDIRVNDIKVNKDIKVHLGDTITIYVLDHLLFQKIKIEKIYEDKNILVVNKTPNVEVTGINSLTSTLEKKFSYIKPCHRLDRNTSGLVLFAKNEESLNILLKKFKNHEIEKHYLAKVFGIPKTNFATLKAYLFKDSKKSMVYISDTPKKGYVQIETSYSVLEKNKTENYSVLDVQLHTGRTHQIRAHLAHIGLPIIGDGKYGINEVNKRFHCKTQQLSAYLIKFNFKTDAGILNYLNGQSITKI